MRVPRSSTTEPASTIECSISERQIRTSSPIFEAPAHNPLLNAAVYAGIGAKLATSLAITAAQRR